MHTLASKVSAHDRKAAPRYYYRLSQNTSCVQTIKNGIQGFLSFLLTEVGVILLIAAYMLCGAVVFQNIEEDSRMEVAVEAEKVF